MESRKWTAEELFEIAKEEYERAGLEVNDECVGEWAFWSAKQEYSSEDEVRDELSIYIADELLDIGPIYPQEDLSEGQIKRIAAKLYRGVETGDVNMSVSNTVHDNVEKIELDDDITVYDTWYGGWMEIGDCGYMIEAYFTAKEMAKLAPYFDESLLPWDTTVYTLKRDGVELCKFQPR